MFTGVLSSSWAVARMGSPGAVYSFGMDKGAHMAHHSVSDGRGLSAFAHPLRVESMLSGVDLFDLLDDVFRHANGGGID